MSEFTAGMRKIFVKDDEQARKVIARLAKGDMPKFSVRQGPVEWEITLETVLVGNRRIFKDIDWS